MPFKVLNIRIKKEQEEGWSLKCKRTDETEVEGKCSSKIFDHSWFFTHLVKLIREYTSWILLTPASFFFSLKEFTSKQLVKTFCFSRQKTYGYLYHACSGCLMFTSLQHLFENGWIFPPKDLEKIRAPKIRMRRFFFFFLSCDIFFLQSNKSYFVLSGLLFICSINKLNKIDFFVIFYFLFIVSSKAIQHTRTTIVFHLKIF